MSDLAETYVKEMSPVLQCLNRRWPPSHYNPSPMFGLRLAQDWPDFWRPTKEGAIASLNAFIASYPRWNAVIGPMPTISVGEIMDRVRTIRADGSYP